MYIHNMDYQIEINVKMRAILIDWLIQVHFTFNLKPETIYITVNIIDRYLEKNQVQTTKLQLVGITAMLIACKYEERYPPEIKNFIRTTNYEYTNKEILEMEIEILKTINFNITYPTIYKFLEIYKIKLNLNDLSFFYSWYCIELCLMDYKMIKYKNSLITASACLITLNQFKNYNNDIFLEKLSYKIEDLKECTDNIILLIKYGKYNLQSIKIKFSFEKYMSVSNIKFD